MQRRPVLVIDDDPQVSELIRDLLAGADLEVVSAPDGPSGIELARTEQPAVILLDMILPGLDGLSTCQRLKQDPVLRNIPVVGITASDDLRYTGKAFRAGFAFFLPKPLRSSTLVRVVELALASSQHETPMQRRRQHPRFRVTLRARCLLRNDTETAYGVEGRTGNVSVGGLLLLVPEKISCGTMLQLVLKLPERPVAARGKVMWQGSRSAEEDQFAHGIQLLGFGEDDGFFQYRRFLGNLAATNPA